MEIKYNSPIQVTKQIKEEVASKMRGICATRTDSNGNHWVSLWYCKPEFKFWLNKIING